MEVNGYKRANKAIKQSRLLWLLLLFLLMLMFLFPMCYCEFHDIIDSILALVADVISIETSRSHGELIHSFEENTYASVGEMVSMINGALKVLEPTLFWINPDCGLKTRGMEETVASLRNMMLATYQVREIAVKV